MKSIFIAFTLLFALPCFAAKVGEKAPTFELKNQSGENVTLEDYKGNFVVLECCSVKYK